MAHRIPSVLKKLICVVLPWRLRRPLLQRFFGYKLHPTSRIGFAWVFPRELVMSEGTSIGHFTVALHLDRIELAAHSSVGRSNWITGFTTGTESPHFRHQKGRRSELIIGVHSAVTKNHHLDCTSPIRIGSFSTVAGYGSQLLTHSIDLVENRQDSLPIEIGNYCFIGTDVVILGGARLPDSSVLGAKSLLNKNFRDTGLLYAGVPAKPIRPIPPEAKYLHRTEGFVF